MPDRDPSGSGLTAANPRFTALRGLTMDSSPDSSPFPAPHTGAASSPSQGPSPAAPATTLAAKTRAEVQKLRRETAKIDADLAASGATRRLELVKAIAPFLTVLAALAAAAVAYYTGRAQIELQSQQALSASAEQRRTVDNQLQAQREALERQLKQQTALAEEERKARYSLLQLQQQEAKERDSEQAYLAWISTDPNSPKFQGHRRQGLSSSIDAAGRSTWAP